jgi:protein involved in polysaccharide export with SLBB domain
MRYAPLLITVALLSGCATRSVGPSFSELPTPESKPVDPYDALRARHLVIGDHFPVVIGLGPNPPVVLDLTVDQEGYVELPQIGKIHVAGMLGTEMEKAVAAEYRKQGIPLHGMIHPGVVE